MASVMCNKVTSANACALGAKIASDSTPTPHARSKECTVVVIWRGILCRLTFAARGARLRWGKGVRCFTRVPLGRAVMAHARQRSTLSGWDSENRCYEAAGRAEQERAHEGLRYHGPLCERRQKPRDAVME